MGKPALFLDRDGVINVDHGYVHSIEKFQFIDGIFNLVQTANENGYLTVIVTNQSGIGRGYYTEAQFHTLTQWMQEKFNQNAARIDKVYFCPFHPTHGIEKYKQDSDLRKPKPGMLLTAATELNIDLEKSIMLGDRDSDMAAGKAAGIQKLILFGDSLCNVKSVIKVQRHADVIPHLAPEHYIKTCSQSHIKELG